MNIKKNILFEDEEENETLNELCLQCPYECKQCKAAQIVTCQYLKENKKNRSKK